MNDGLKQTVGNSEDFQKWVDYASALANQSSSEGTLSPDILDFLVLLVDELKLDKEAVGKAYFKYMMGERKEIDWKPE